MWDYFVKDDYLKLLKEQEFENEEIYEFISEEAVHGFQDRINYVRNLPYISEDNEQLLFDMCRYSFRLAWDLNDKYETDIRTADQWMGELHQYDSLLTQVKTGELKDLYNKFVANVK